MMKKTTIVTDCGHQFKTGYNTDILADATMDCRLCGALLIFPRATTIGSCVRARHFNAFIHEEYHLWPKHGTGAGYIEF